MQVGLMFSHRNPPQWRVPWPQLYAQTLEQVRFAEQLGFDSVFSTEHHFVEDGYSPALMPIEAAWAASTSRVHIGSFVLLLPMQHPLRLAEDAAAVDIISNGRLILGMGLGYRGEEFASFGIPQDRLGRIMDEALEVLLRAWTEDCFSFRGRHFSFTNVAMHPKPVQQPRPPVWVGRAGPPGVKRVARFSLEGFCGAPTRETYDLYLRHCREFGTAPRAEAQVLVFGHLHEDGEQAWAEAEPHAAYVRDCYQGWRRQAGDTQTFRQGLAQDFIIGDPAHWVQRLRERITLDSQAIKPSHLVVQLQLAGMPHERVLRSMELFARQVLPHIRN